MLLKNILLLHLIAMFLVCSCRDSNLSSVKKFIPGTYSRFAQHEFGKEYDTVIISLLNKVADQYQITRKWKYERVLDGQLIDPEYKVSKSTGFYDLKRRYLRDNESGEVYSFDVKNKILLNGSVKYQKL